MTSGYTGRHLTVIACAAGPATDVAALVKAALADGWGVNVIATPDAVSFMDIPALEDLSSAPVRSQPRVPGTPSMRTIRPADALIVAPATFNSINKLAAGIVDTYALTVIAEAIGAGTPVVIVPFVNAALASRLPYRLSLRQLRDEGVRVIEGRADDWVPPPPGTGATRQRDFPWQHAIAEARRLAAR